MLDCGNLRVFIIFHVHTSFGGSANYNTKVLQRSKVKGRGKGACQSHEYQSYEIIRNAFHRYKQRRRKGGPVGAIAPPQYLEEEKKLFRTEIKNKSSSNRLVSGYCG